MRSLPLYTAVQSFLIMTIICCLPVIAITADKAGYAGWEKGSAYDQHYNFKERDSVKGKVDQFIEVTPLPGMAPGTAFILDEGGEKIEVHLCPLAYSDAAETGIRQDVSTKVSGSWAVIDGKDVLMAAKIKQGDDFVFKVRLTKDGTPFWSLTPEELAQEKAAE